MRAYAVCIGVKPECRRTESEMVGDGQGRADKVDEVYHDNLDKVPSKQSSDFKCFCNSLKIKFCEVNRAST